jgi:copper type II ascorbate-dependent monooxygenase-like protein
MTPGQEPRRDPRARRHSAIERAVLVLGLGLAATGVLIAQSPKTPAANGATPTFAEHVAPILYKNCTMCHRPGGIGPFSMFDYDSVKARILQMRVRVSLGQMPPWHAVGPRGVFKNDRRLSDADKNTIIRWIDAGAKPGNLKKLPPRPEYPTLWSIGTPDVVLSMDQEFAVPATGTIEYQYFEVPTNFTEDKWIQAYEIMPGSRPVVHHVQVYARMPPAPPRPPGSPAFQPALVRNREYEPLPAPKPTGLWSRFLAKFKAKKPEQPNRGTLIASMAPGTNAVEFPKGTAMLIRAGTVLTFVMHYTAHGQHVMKDRTAVGFRLAKGPPEEEIYASAFTNETFTIPAGAKVQVPGEIGTRDQVKFWGLLPHTHLRGTGWKYTLVKADGTSEVILDVPNYDFNWQIYYLWEKPLELKAGDKIMSLAWYDNSASNKSNPDPTKVVKDGPQTWDEMQYTGFLFSVPSWDRAKAARP